MGDLSCFSARVYVQAWGGNHARFVSSSLSWSWSCSIMVIFMVMIMVLFKIITFTKNQVKKLVLKIFLEPTNYSCCVKYSNILSFFCFFILLPSSLGPCVWPLQTSTPLSPPTYLNPLENASCQNPHWKPGGEGKYLTHLNFLRRTLRAKRKVWKRNKSHFRWNYPDTVTH